MAKYLTEEQEKQCRSIYNHFGQETQIEKFKEETLELLEEFADVYIICFQLKKHKGLEILIETAIECFDCEELGFDNTKKFKKMVDYKINRTLERIETGYYDTIPELNELSLEEILKLKYTIHLRSLTKNEGGGFSSYVKELGEYTCVGWGKTIDESMASLTSCKEELLTKWYNDNVKIPLPAKL